MFLVFSWAMNLRSAENYCGVAHFHFSRTCFGFPPLLSLLLLFCSGTKSSSASFVSTLFPSHEGEEESVRAPLPYGGAQKMGKSGVCEQETPTHVQGCLLSAIFFLSPHLHFPYSQTAGRVTKDANFLPHRRSPPFLLGYFLNLRAEPFF